MTARLIQSMGSTLAPLSLSQPTCRIVARIAVTVAIKTGAVVAVTPSPIKLEASESAPSGKYSAPLKAAKKRMTGKMSKRNFIILVTRFQVFRARKLRRLND